MIIWIVNDEISNYRSDYFLVFISEYLNANTRRQLAMNPENGQYEYIFISNTENRPILEAETKKNIENLTVDVGSQSSILKQLNTLTKIAQNKAKKQPNIKNFYSVAQDIVKKGKITSLIYDDMLDNGSSFIQDFEEHPIVNQQNISKFPAQAFAREKGEVNWYDNVSENDMAVAKDIITNPENQLFNIKVDNSDNFGLTETLLIEYIAGHFEQHYKGASGTADKKPVEMAEGGEQRQPMSREDILNKYNI